MDMKMDMEIKMKRGKDSRNQQSARKKQLLSMVMAVLVAMTMLLPSGANAQITASAPPSKTNYGTIKWEEKLGKDYRTDAFTPPVVVGDYVYVYKGHYVYEKSKENGKVTRKWVIQQGSPGFATLPLTVSDDKTKLYGTAYDVNSEDGEEYTWLFQIDLSKDPEEDTVLFSEYFSGQNINPVIYKNGYVYCGIYGFDNTDSYFCIDPSTMAIKNGHEVMKTVWVKEGKDLQERAVSGRTGYYWFGAYVSNDNNTIVLGRDNGKLYVVKNTAQSVSEIWEKSGGFSCDAPIRSTIVGNVVNKQEYIYVVTRGSDSARATESEQCGTVYKFRLNDGGNLEKMASEKLAGASVGEPIINGTKLYVSYENGMASYEIAGDQLNKIDTIKTPGWVKGHLLYSTANNCIYGQMYKGAGIYYVQTDKTGHFTKQGNLYTTNHLDYGGKSIFAGYDITCDENGNIYCKNDEGYLMCIKAGYDMGAPTLSSVKGLDYRSAKITWKQKQNIASYQLQRSDGKSFKISASSTSYVDRSLTAGKQYSYTLRALCGESTYSKSSGKKYVKTVPATPKLSVKVGKRKASLSWSKAGGVKVYQVYRATKKKGKYKLVKTTTKRTWVNKRLKKKKMYYFKVRGYTTAQGKKTYGRWSSVRSCRVR